MDLFCTLAVAERLGKLLKCELPEPVLKVCDDPAGSLLLSRLGLHRTASASAGLGLSYLWLPSAILSFCKRIVPDFVPLALSTRTTRASRLSRSCSSAARPSSPSRLPHPNSTKQLPQLTAFSGFGFELVGSLPQRSNCTGVSAPWLPKSRRVRARRASQCLVRVCPPRPTRQVLRRHCRYADAQSCSYSCSCSPDVWFCG